MMQAYPGKNARRDPHPGSRLNPRWDPGWGWRDPRWDPDRDYGTPRVGSHPGSRQSWVRSQAGSCLNPRWDPGGI